MAIKIIIATIAVLALLEGLFAIVAPNQIKIMLKFFTKKKISYFRKVGLIELIIAAVVLVIVYFV